MPIEITMPQLSDTMTEGTVVKWKKNQGDAVKAGEEIADIETDKATMPMEAFEDGVLAVINAAEGQKVNVGDVIAILATAGEDAAAIKAAGPGKKSATSGSAPAAKPASGGNASAAPAGSVSPFANENTPPAPVTSAPATNVEPERVVASPLARRIAADMNIDLTGVKGTGPGGRVVQKDLEGLQQGKTVAGQAPATSAAQIASAGKAPSSPATKTPAVPLQPRILSGQKQVVPLTKMRSVIAQRLQASKQNIPHFYEVIDIDCEAINTLRAKLNTALEKEGIRLSIADFIAKALASALAANPTLNATFDGQQVTLFGDVNLGMAVSLPDGLIVPVLRGVNQMGLKEIRQRTADLIDRARQQKLKQDELTGATFTISNLGNYGVREFSAIINPPEVAILAIGGAEKRAVVIEDVIVMRTMMTVCLSADHRVVDGAAAAEFLRTFKQMMEEPGLMLA